MIKRTRSTEGRPMTAFQTEPCSRCGGSGRYSFNQRDGDRCWGCDGKGLALTKSGARVRAAWLAANTETVVASDVRADDVLILSGRRVRVATVEHRAGTEDDNFGRSRSGDGPWRNLSVRIVIGQTSHLHFATDELERWTASVPLPVLAETAS